MHFDYEEVLKDIMSYGERVKQRAKLSDGRVPECFSIFGYQMKIGPTKFNSQAAPVVTTKKVAWKAAIHELIWFLRGSTNIAYLKENGVKIWDQWADKNGELGPVYGKQWRDWKKECGMIDQIGYIEDSLKSIRLDPNHHSGRRLLLSSWNPGDMPEAKVPTGCHTFCQFSVRPTGEKFLSRGEIVDHRLDCHLYMRSCDAFLGLPFNIISYWTLKNILGKRANLTVGNLTISFGDLHIYDNHFDQVQEQLSRSKHDNPELWISDSILDSKDLKDLRIDQFNLIGYDHHPALKGEVAV